MGDCLQVERAGYGLFSYHVFPNNEINEAASVGDNRSA
jgi:hypothetical protein